VSLVNILLIYCIDLACKRSRLCGGGSGETDGVSELRFELLGPVRAWRGSLELKLGSPQQRAILAALLLAHGRHVSLGALIDALWGEQPPRAAASTVHTYMSRLRRCLDLGAGGQGRDVIKLVGDGYTLRLGSARLDLDDFVQLTRDAQAARLNQDAARASALFRGALALWRGMPLAGIPGPYADSQRARLADLRAAAIEDGLAMDIDSGGHLAAVPELRVLLAADPLREKLSELLMLALYRSGRQAEALTVFGGSRRLLREELGIDPGPSLREMHQRILRADSRLAGQAGMEHRPAIWPGALLPSALADFTGRAEDLAAIVRVLCGGAPAPVIVISGMPGIGKTALAVQAARAVQDEFPDGQLFAELSNLDDTAADPADVLAGFLRAAGISAVPETLFERVVTWRAALAGRRAVIVLDDVRDTAQVRHLLPPAGCAVIITGRRSLIDLPGAQCFEITRLRPEEALTLLKRLVGTRRVAAEQAAAERLVAACAYQPLAVRTAGMRLAVRPGWQIAAMQRQLQEELSQPMVIHADCELVEAPFESAYCRLSPDAALVFRQASTGEGLQIPVDETSAALNFPGHVTRALLDSLADVHLIEPDAVSGGFRYDPLVKLFAWRKALAADGRVLRQLPGPGRSRFSHLGRGASWRATVSCATTTLPASTPDLGHV
jgi:DNA-binding SARP family transcriptional activator